MSRFDNIPNRLRSGATLLANPKITDGQFMAVTGLMEDAALKIEALEREALHIATKEPK